MAITVTLAETSNRDWKYQFEVVDEETGDPIDLTGAFIAIAITDTEGCQKIYATTDNGKISILDVGVIALAIPYSETNLCAGSYEIGGYYQLNGDTPDLLEGTISVRAGRPRP
jgi:hypothetical protein